MPGSLGVRPSVPEKPANNPAAGKATGEPSRRVTGQRAEGSTAASWCWCLWTQGKHAVFLLYAFSEPRTSCGQEQLKNSLYFSNIFQHIGVTVQCVTSPLCPVKEPRSARPVRHSGPASSGVLPTKRNPDVYRLALSPKTSTVVPDGAPQT